MLLIAVCTILIIAMTWSLLKWNKVKYYWAVRNVPHKKPHPIFGSLTFLMKENPGIWIRKLYDEIRSPYVGIWLFWRPALVINSPEIARTILIKEADIFRDRHLSSGKKDIVGSLNIFSVDDPLWSNVRKGLNPVFTSAKLKGMQNMMQTKSKNLKVRIQEHINNNQIIDLRSLFSDFSTDVIGEATFGVKCEATLTGHSELREVTKEFMKFDIVRAMSWISIFFMPKLCDLFGFVFFPRHSVDRLRLIFRAMVQQRGGYETTNFIFHDILEALIKLKQQNEDIDEETLLAQATILVQGGFDTTAVSLTFSIYELAYQPQLQDRLFREIKEAKEANGGADFDSNVLAELPLLNAVIDETLRKYPPMGWLDRKAKADYKINENLTVEQGTIVYVNAIGMHYDPEYFPSPKTFDPERFLPENKHKIIPYTFIPFGDGPRHCIGKRFALQALRFALSTIFLNYEVRPLPGAPKPDECHIENRGLLLMPDAVMSVQFIPRS